MIKISEARKKVLAACPSLDKFAASAVAEKLSRFVYDAADLTNARITGAVAAHIRHTRTDYDKQLAAEKPQYGSARYYDLKHAASKF